MKKSGNSTARPRKKRESKRKRLFSRKPRRQNADGVSIYISPLMLLMAVYFTVTGMAFEFVCSVSAVLLHECAHARVAKKFGYTLDRIKLMPYGAALCGSADMRVKHEVIVAAAGPIFNLAICAFTAALWWLAPSSYMFTYAFCAGNLYVGLFNLLPVYPLDGGRVALAALGVRLGRKKAYAVMRAVSAAVGIAAIALFALGAAYAVNPCLLGVGIFMVFSAFFPGGEARYASLSALPYRRTRIARPFDVKTLAVGGNATAGELLAAVDADRYTVFDVVDGDTMRRLGSLDEGDVLRAAKSGNYSATARELVISAKFGEIA